jgi:peptidoglycan/xylan/chitin deacetylase (PgdA/CDA1 family)
MDKSGNRATRTVTYSVITREQPAPQDTTPPTIALRSPNNGAKYTFGSAVRADYSCSDNVTLVSCEGTVADDAPVPTDVLGKHTISVTAKDAAGNVSTEQVTYTVTDPQPPTITLTAPPAGSTFTWNQPVTVGYTCEDEVSLASCVATVGNTTVPNGGTLPTSGAPGPGSRTLHVEASDSSGNVTTKEVQYTVQPAGYYALTFDDGPNALYTQPVLDALASANAKATFFLVGSQIQQFPGLAQALVAGGHSLQNHTMTHANISGAGDPSDPTVPAPSADPSGEITKASAAIQAVGAPAPQFLRPPYGMYDANTVALARSLGLEISNWTTDTNDYTGISPTAIAANAIAVPDKGIVLMHDSNQNTVDAIPLIVNRLRDERGMLPGRLAKSTTQHFITGWEDAGGGLGFYAEAVAP